MKATPTSIPSNSDDISTALVSKAGDVMMMSSSQKGKILKKNSDGLFSWVYLPTYGKSW